MSVFSFSASELVGARLFLIMAVSASDPDNLNRRQLRLDRRQV